MVVWTDSTVASAPALYREMIPANRTANWRRSTAADANQGRVKALLVHKKLRAVKARGSSERVARTMFTFRPDGLFGEERFTAEGSPARGGEGENRRKERKRALRRLV